MPLAKVIPTVDIQEKTSTESRKKRGGDRGKIDRGGTGQNAGRRGRAEKYHGSVGGGTAVQCASKFEGAESEDVYLSQIQEGRSLNASRNASYLTIPNSRMAPHPHGKERDTGEPTPTSANTKGVTKKVKDEGGRQYVRGKKPICSLPRGSKTRDDQDMKKGEKVCSNATCLIPSKGKKEREIEWKQSR